MGTPLAPAVANLFMAWLEERLLDSSPVPVSAEFWRRFIDDIFVLWRHSDEDLEQFIDHLNSFHPTIKFTFESSSSKLSFLDIEISLKDGYLHSDLFTKPTDSRGYLSPRSCHPGHVHKSIPYSQFLRLRRLCSEETAFKRRCHEMVAHFKARGYSYKILKTALEKVSHTSRQETLKYRSKDTATASRPPLVVTHNPANPPLRTWTKELHEVMVQSSSEMQKAVPDPPLVAERNCNSLRNIIMPTSLPPSLDDFPGSFRCSKKKCITCSQHLVESARFTSSQTGEIFTIRHRMSCETTNIVYLLYCDLCQNTQYIGETQNSLKSRFYQHRSNVNKNTGTHVTLHFNRPSHTLQNIKCLPIEKVYSDTKEKRLQREFFWMNKLKTVYPMGLNTLA
ncbi:hypothetical protein ACOMHN_011166 [Nucella lapillus]